MERGFTALDIIGKRGNFGARLIVCHYDRGLDQNVAGVHFQYGNRLLFAANVVNLQYVEADVRSNRANDAAFLRVLQIV